MGIEELRIGNYVEYNGCTGVVYAVHSPIPCEDEHFRDIGIVELVIGGIVTARIDEINPIPLTEELLLKFGFELRYKTEDGMIYGLGNITLIYCHTTDNDFGFFLNGYHNDVHIQELHQLQNLYHSLTGKELEIKK